MSKKYHVHIFKITADTDTDIIGENQDIAVRQALENIKTYKFQKYKKPKYLAMVLAEEEVTEC